MGLTVSRRQSDHRWSVTAKHDADAWSLVLGPMSDSTLIRAVPWQWPLERGRRAQFAAHIAVAGSSSASLLPLGGTRFHARRLLARRGAVPSLRRRPLRKRATAPRTPCVATINEHRELLTRGVTPRAVHAAPGLSHRKEASTRTGRTGGAGTSPTPPIRCIYQRILRLWNAELADRPGDKTLDVLRQ